MPTTPRFGVRFRYRPTDEYLPAAARTPAPERGVVERQDRVPIYLRAVELAASVHTVIELALAERYFLRDQLDRKSLLVPQLIAQGLAIPEMPARRELYRQARRALTDCATIFDTMIARGSVGGEALDGVRRQALALIEDLLPLTVDPPTLR